MNIIQKNLDKPWNWWNISLNPNITPQIVKDNPDEQWHWCNLSQNEMDQSYYYSSHHKKHLANQLASAIFDELIAVACNPRRHPVNHTALCDLVDHPFEFLNQDELNSIYD